MTKHQKLILTRHLNNCKRQYEDQMQRANPAKIDELHRLHLEASEMLVHLEAMPTSD